MSTNIATIILAAGASTRMEGHIKQLLPWGNTTLLGNSIVQAKKVSGKVCVVLGAHLDEIRKELPLHTYWVHNPEWKSGMGSSIASGVNTLINEGNTPDGILIMLADQPMLTASYLSKLKSAFAEGNNSIVATEYPNGLGVPALFDKSLFPVLSGLNREFGARQVIMSQKSLCLGIDPMGKAMDIDTLLEYNHISRLQGFKHEIL
nr:nucleotidyltransferase family protein [Allomuricauda sp.]